MLDAAIGTCLVLQAEFLRRFEPVSLWQAAIIQNVASFVGLALAGLVDLAPTKKTARINQSYMFSLLLPIFAYQFSNRLGTVPYATLIRSTSMLWTLVLSRDFSRERVYGAAFVVQGIVVAVWGDQRAPVGYFDLIACGLLAAGTLCGALVGIFQQNAGGSDDFIYITAAIMFSIATPADEWWATPSWYSTCGLAVTSALGAVLLRKRSISTNYNAFQLTMLLNVRRFATIFIGSLTLAPGENALPLLCGLVFVSVGVFVAS